MLPREDYKSNRYAGEQTKKNQITFKRFRQNSPQLYVDKNFHQGDQQILEYNHTSARPVLARLLIEMFNKNLFGDGLLQILDHVSQNEKNVVRLPHECGVTKTKIRLKS